jgi:branched-chain amino acid transport system permease protein
VDILNSMLAALLSGLINGTVYGLIGLGVVLIFKSQRVINFAQGEFATTAAFVLYYFTSVYDLRTRLPLGQLGGYLVAILAALVAAVLLAVIVERVVVRPLRGSPDVTVFVATAGVALFIIAVTLLLVGPNILIVDPMLPKLEAAFAERGQLGLVSPQRLIMFGVFIASAISLALFFSRSALGKAILAMSAEPFAVRLAGIRTERMSILVWGMSGLISGAAGVAFIPTTALTPGFFTRGTLIAALTAVVIGGLTSLPGAFAGGLAIGLIQAFTAQFVPASIPEPGTIAVFIILLLTLLLRPQGLLAKEA